MYKIVYTNRMKKDVKLMKKRGKDMRKLVNALSLLASGTPLPAQLMNGLYTEQVMEYHLQAVKVH